MTKQIQRYGTSSAPREDGVFCLWSEYEKVVTERDALRAALATPVFTAGYSPYLNALVGLEGAHWDVAYDVFANSAQLVTVYYGEKRVYPSMAEFCAAHPKEPK